MRQGLDLADCAAATRIRERYLIAIEDGRFESLPGPAYVSGFVRAYASHLGVKVDGPVKELPVPGTPSPTGGRSAARPVTVSATRITPRGRGSAAAMAAAARGDRAPPDRGGGAGGDRGGGRPDRRLATWPGPARPGAIAVARGRRRDESGVIPASRRKECDGVHLSRPLHLREGRVARHGPPPRGPGGGRQGGDRGGRREPAGLLLDAGGPRRPGDLRGPGRGFRSGGDGGDLRERPGRGRPDERAADAAGGARRPRAGEGRREGVPAPGWRPRRTGASTSRRASRAERYAAAAVAGPARHRASPCQRYIVVRDGGRAGPREARCAAAGRSRCAAAPRRPTSPSASRRRSGQEYDPGRARGAGPVACRSSRSRCTRRARSRRAVRHPAAAHTARSDTQKSRPARLR